MNADRIIDKPEEKKCVCRRQTTDFLNRFITLSTVNGERKYLLLVSSTHYNQNQE